MQSDPFNSEPRLLYSLKVSEFLITIFLLNLSRCK